MPKQTYLLYDDSRSIYFHGIGIGLFWICGSRQGAAEFKTRAAAVKVLHHNRKHLQGWRVIAEDKV